MNLVIEENSYMYSEIDLPYLFYEQTLDSLINSSI